ncbi:MAG: RHS repeat-associated core domain-containing protein, partial [Terriglobia bacterium]
MHTYQYNGEGRLLTVDNGATMTFGYNALEERVVYDRAGFDFNVLFDPSGQLLSYWDLTLADWGFQRFWLGGRTFAYYNDDDNGQDVTRLEHADALGSATMVTDQSGSVVTDQMFSPTGELWQGPSTEDPTFAGLLGDDRYAGLDPAPFREYSPGQGRWLTPDPAGLGAVDLTNPQSLNRYAYALNNPETMIDPSGLGPLRYVPPG